MDRSDPALALLEAAATGQLFAGQAHDLNNSMQAITTALDVLERKCQADASQTRLIVLAKGALAHAVEISRGLHLFAKAMPSADQTLPWWAGMRARMGQAAGASILVMVETGDDPAPPACGAHLAECLAVLVAQMAQSHLPQGGQLSLSISRPGDLCLAFRLDRAASGLEDDIPLLSHLSQTLGGHLRSVGMAGFDILLPL